MENERILIKEGQSKLAFQEHISTYLLALCYLNKVDIDLQKKESLWRKIVYFGSKNERYFLKLKKYLPKENEIILEAIKLIDVVEEEAQFSTVNSVFDAFVWAISSYEHEEL